MRSTHYVEALQSTASRLEDSNTSASDLLDSILAEPAAKEAKLKVQQKQMILDSFRISKFHRDVKNWQHSVRAEFIDNDITQYNRKLAEMDKINFELEDIEKEYEAGKKQLKLPQMKLAVQTIQKYEDGALVQFVKEGQKQIDVSEFFSLDPSSDKPLINYEIFSMLVNIEFRLRVERMVKYELLSRIKNDLGATSRKWNSRNTRIEKFFNDDLAKMVDEVNKVRQDELEQYEEEEEDEDEEYEQKMEDEKIEDDIVEEDDDAVEKDDDVAEKDDELAEDKDEDDVLDKEAEPIPSPDKESSDQPTQIEDHNDDMNID